uniref:C3/C5 convertase n=1 Tax=Monopterus albus TaxID=43700 RepID=A0A3Q3IXE0_MONAL|nr:complement factor B-like [Monopterus albus]
MRLSVEWSWFVALSCLLCMGGEVQCACSDEDIKREGVEYTLTRQLEKGSMLVYNCPEGFYPFPALTRMCQANGSWRPAPRRFSPQKCKPVECPDPTVLENGNVSPPQEKYFVGNETMYECYSGYTMRGSNQRVCLKNGKWSGSTPVCSRDSENACPDPGIPAGASRTGNIFGIDDKVKYTCNGNLFLVGSSERVCKEGGQWTGQEPACYYRHTYDTIQEVSESFGSAIRNSLTTLESTDDIQGEKRIRLSKNGTLNIYIAVDVSESIEAIYFLDAKKAVIALIEKISSFSVTPNYHIVFFSSEIFPVVDILDMLDGKVQLSSVKKELKDFKISDQITAGTDLNLIFSNFLERMAIIEQQVGKEAFKEHRHALIIFTDGAYNMGGSPAPTVAQIKNKVYMNYTGETSTREDYLDIYIFGIGAEVFDDDLQPLTTTKANEKHYFRMKGLDRLQDTFDEMIDEDAVKGLCGLHKDYDRVIDKDDIERKKKMYPWLAFIYIEGGRKCLGSLVNSKMILTAAHCFRFGDKPDDVKVEIDDRMDRKVKKVKTFILHPNYNIKGKVDEGVDEFYDYDVALIQLEKDVKISISVRPICIPCTQETSEALQMVGKSTCKAQEQLLLKTQLEELNFMTRTDKWAAEKNVRAKLGDNRGDCIRHALEAKGIKTKNPEVAVTDNFLCTGGLTPQRDHIACTGDSGGAVFKHHHQRTVQIGVVSWGTKNKCEGGGVVESDDASRDFHINLFRVVPFLKQYLGNDTQNDFEPLQFVD